MSRRLACPGSLELERDLPDTAGVDAKLGTFAHEIAATALAIGREVLESPPTLCNRCNDPVTSPPCQQCGSSEYRIDTELIAAVAVYVDYINHLRSTYDYLDEAIETTIESTAIADLGGTVDYKAIYRDGEVGVVGHIVDYKHGVGVPVSPAGNAQLLTYALLARELHPHVKLWRMTIVQPRSGSGSRVPETVDVTGDELDAHRDQILAMVGSSALSPGDHCRWCKAKASCPALIKRAEDLLDGAIDNLPEIRAAEPAVLEQRYVELLKYETAIGELFKAIRERMLEGMQRGERYDGYKVIRAIGNRAWSDTEEKVLRRLKSRAITKRQATETRLRSPAAIERDFGPDAIRDLVTRSDLGFRVVPATARGEAVSFTALDDVIDAELLAPVEPTIDIFS
jgi:hypothetical protein